MKTYVGPQAARRLQVERRALELLAGQIPVPTLLGGDSVSLSMEFVAGHHGQELVSAGFASEVLTSCGEVLRTLHSIDPTVLFDDANADDVIVHGDFGPNNVLFVGDGFAVAALLDWEFCHSGSRVEDLAWCEWIIRAHHPSALAELPSLFAGYGWIPTWTDRKDCMVRRCAELEQFCREWDLVGSGAETWIERGRQAAMWNE